MLKLLLYIVLDITDFPELKYVFLSFTHISSRGYSILKICLPPKVKGRQLHLKMKKKSVKKATIIAVIFYFKMQKIKYNSAYVKQFYYRIILFIILKEMCHQYDQLIHFHVFYLIT